MTRIVLDASVPHAKVKIGREDDTFVVAFPNHGFEIVFADSLGTYYGAAVLAAGVGLALHEKAQEVVGELLEVAEATAQNNGRLN